MTDQPNKPKDESKASKYKTFGSFFSKSNAPNSSSSSGTMKKPKFPGLFKVSRPPNEDLKHHEDEQNSARNSNSSSVSRTKSKTEVSIEVEHPEYEVTYAMMLGIRTSIGKVYNIPKRDPMEEDYKEEKSYYFPKKGGSKTPAHKARDFKFKDYQPQVFRRIREHFRIDAAEYTMTVTNNHYLEFISNSKSGQFFFYTHNKQFMIKTMSKQECKFLRSILADYYNVISFFSFQSNIFQQFIIQNPNTLLTRFYGIYRVKLAGSKTMRFLIMGSVFYTHNFIHEMYDLKGSLEGRKATPKEREQEVPVLKDLDFLEGKMKIRIDPEKSKILASQLDRDSQFLQKLNIMDYSLLLGIHYSDREHDPVLAYISQSPPSDAENPNPEELAQRLAVMRRQSHYGLQNQQNVITTKTATEYFMDSSLPESLVTPKNEKQKPREKDVSVFNSDLGGVQGVNEDGSRANCFYYMGIIDILQQYNVKKRIETSYKSMLVDEDRISSVKPEKYAKRFSKFISDAIHSHSK
jgi:1-phosphatidylinositol-4-phosphate 5-kinase